MSRHLSTRDISSKSMHAFLSNLANRQTDRRADKHGQKHLPPPLSELNNLNIKISYANTYYKHLIYSEMKSVNKNGNNMQLHGTVQYLEIYVKRQALCQETENKFYVLVR